MAFSFSPTGLAHASARHPWKVVGLWLVLLVVSIGLMTALLADALTTGQSMSSNPDSKKGQKLLEDRLRGPQRDSEAVIIYNSGKTVDDAAFKAKVQEISTSVAGAKLPGSETKAVQSSTDFYASSASNLVSNDKHATMIPITLAGKFDKAVDYVKPVLDIAKANDGKDGFNVYVSGNAALGDDFSTTSEKDLQTGEMFGSLIALIILVLVFGAVVAAFVPVILAIFSIIAALGMTALLGTQFQFSFFVTNMITMMGLAVGIDYTLFILSRFREERERGRPVLEAVDVASSTAGRAVLFSGFTVIIALLGLLIVPQSIYRSLAVGATLAVSFAILASITLLPAIMRLLGDKVNKLRLPFQSQNEFDEDHPGGFWDKVATTVMKHPVIGVVAVTTVLLACSAFYLDINAGSSGVSSLPNDFQSKKGFELLKNDFGGGQVSPAEVVIDGNSKDPAIVAGVAKLQTLIKNDSIFGAAAIETNNDNNLTLVSIPVAADPSAKVSTSAIRKLRSDYVPQAFAGAPAKVYVTGITAGNVDFFDLTDTYTPIVFAFVLGLSFLLLMLVFRSIVVPAKAIIMNLLSVGAAYGLIVLVFQKGVGADLLGFQQVDAIEAWLPLFLFSVLFGLSMDYHVFLLSRVRERYLKSNDNTDAVAFGLRSTGRLITGAALIMVAVFGGFAMGSLASLQQVGFGLGVAVFLDATVVRSVLVPASMRLLGKANWYLPPVLSWLPHIGVEGKAEPASSYAPEPAGGGS